MGELRCTFTIIIYIFLLSQKTIIGAEIEVKVTPGDNITLYCDRPLTHGFNIVWIRNSSLEHEPPLIIDYWIVDQESFQSFRFIDNPNNNSVDLYIANITVSDLGLYFCAEFERKLQKDENGLIYPSDVYYYGNQTTRLTLAEQVCHCSDHTRTISPPPPSFSETCNMRLLSVCSICVILFTLLTAVCVYFLWCAQTTGSKSEEMLTVNFLKVDHTETHQCEMRKTGNICLHSEVTYRLLPSAHANDKI